jgi:cAMP-dependent protein kinase regulator
MSSNTKIHFTIPEGLTDLLQEFTVEILRKRPKDLVEFGADYFNDLLNKRNQIKESLKIHEEKEDECEEEPEKEKDDDKEEEQEVDDEEEEEDDDELPEELPNLPKRSYGRRVSVAAEKYNPEEDTDDEPKVIHAKTDDERSALKETIKNIFMFRSLDPNQVNDLLDAMFSRVVEANEVIIEQGDDGDNFYVIESGSYDIIVNDKNVGSYTNKGQFGELALMYNMPRAATIIATTPGRLWALDRLTFKRIVVKSAFEKRKNYEALLENMPIFKTLSPYQKMSVADALFSKKFNDGEEIIKQGDEAKCMYFVENGNVKIVRSQDGESKELKVCNKGDYFGELALLTKKPRAATVLASGEDVKCAILDIEAFERLLGPCIEIMKNNIPNYEVTLKNVFGNHAACVVMNSE